MGADEKKFKKGMHCFALAAAWIFIMVFATETAFSAGKKTWLEKMAQTLGELYNLDIPPESITLRDASGKRYTCTGHYAYPEKVETSGLFFSPENSRFYTVVDKGKPHVYEFVVNDNGIFMTSSWKIKQQKNLDFEGIDWLQDGDHGLLAVIGEKTTKKDEGRVLLINPVSRRVETTITVPFEKAGRRNTYLEGIAIDNRHKRIYLAKERQPLALYMLDFKGRVLDSMDEKEMAAFYRAFTDKHDVPSYMGHLVGPSLSGLEYEEETGLLVILNRSYRQIILARNKAENTLDLELLDVLTFRIPENNIYGNAEGVAVADFGRGRNLLLTTDPGAGETPALTIFDFPPAPEGKYPLPDNTSKSQR